MDDRLRIGVLTLLPCVLVVIRLTSERLRMFGDVWLYIKNKKGLHITCPYTARGSRYCRK